MNKNNEEALAE